MGQTLGFAKPSCLGLHQVERQEMAAVASGMARAVERALMDEGALDKEAEEDQQRTVVVAEALCSNVQYFCLCLWHLGNLDCAAVEPGTY